MADPRGFLKIKRLAASYRPVCERVKDYKDVVNKRPNKYAVEQATRCMDCGTPFCHWGCPVSNLIPEWNDLLHKGRWREAWVLLQSTNNFPEITGRICPALCEYSCVLGINDDPVTIRENELAIIEHAFKKGYVKPRKVTKRTNKRIAVVGSGPTGLACADQLNMSGHKVTVFEKDDKLGGILRYGMPDFKLEKWVLDRRIKLLKKEGIVFKTRINVGKDYSSADIKKKFDAVCLTGGSRKPRDLSIEGRDLKGIHFAMDYLTQSNMRVQGAKFLPEEMIDAKDKTVIVVGGGDTGSDCVGTANRQGAKCVVQIELLPKPSEKRTKDYQWPKYPLLLKTSSSHEEGSKRDWSVLTKKFRGEDSQVKGLLCTRIEFKKDKKTGRMAMKEIKGSEFEITADLVLLSIGFVHPEHKGLLEQLKLRFDNRGNVATEDYMTSKKGFFSAGDMHRGQSLVVWAIQEGREAAVSINNYLSAK